MRFRLVYEGFLLDFLPGADRYNHIHEIRQIFHRQIKRVVEINPVLNDIFKAGKPHERKGYRITAILNEKCNIPFSIDMLILCKQPNGFLIGCGDIDQRPTLLFDSLRIPTRDEWGGYEIPNSDEHPFFCLLEHSKQITNITIETDYLLQPKNNVTKDVLVIIEVKILP